MPVRIQRRRAKGWRMPEGAVYVGRPTQWGNPFVLKEVAPVAPKPEPREHPHFEEYGRFTGKIITMKFGIQNQMAEVKLEHCRHGTDACFVSKGDVVQVGER